MYVYESCIVAIVLSLLYLSHSLLSCKFLSICTCLQDPLEDQLIAEGTFPVENESLSMYLSIYLSKLPARYLCKYAIWYRKRRRQSVFMNYTGTM